METVDTVLKSGNNFQKNSQIRPKIDTDLDYDSVAREVIRLLRGERSQRQVSQKMGYTFNKVGKWESGVTQIKWVDFIQASRALDCPVDENLRFFFGNYEGSFEPEEIVKFLDVFLALGSCEDPRIQSLQRKWKNNGSSPNLGEVFLVLDSRPSMLVGFLTQYVDCSKICGMKERFESFNEQLNILSADPNAGYVNEALKVKEYVELKYHDDEILARHASCSVKQLKKTLEVQIHIGAVYFDGKKYIPSPFEYSFSSLNNPQIRVFNKYTVDMVAKKYPKPNQRLIRNHAHNSSVTSSRVVAISREASLEIDKLVSKFHNEVGRVVNNDNQPKDNVQIISLASVVTALEVVEKDE